MNTKGGAVLLRWQPLIVDSLMGAATAIVVVAFIHAPADVLPMLFVAGALIGAALMLELHIPQRRSDDRSGHFNAAVADASGA